MRLRGGHVVVLVILALAALVAARVLMLSFGGPGGRDAGTDEDDFLAEARQLAERDVDSPVAGALPPADGDATLVPVLVVDPPELLDLGVVPHDEITRGEIKLYNKGRTRLEITQVNSSCVACTPAYIAEADKSIAPGGEGTVAVTLRPDQVAGFESRKTVTIMSNDPHHASVDVTVLAKIDPEFLVDPPALDFGELRQGETPEKTVLFRQLADAPIEITGVELDAASGAALQLSFSERAAEERLDPGRAEYTIAVRLPGDVPPGPFAAVFQIVNTCARLPKFKYVVKGTVTSFYTVSPSGPVILRALPGVADVPPATVTFSSEQPFELVDLQATSGDVEAALRTGDEPNTAVVELRLRPDAAAGARQEGLLYTIRSAEETARGRIVLKVVGLRQAGSDG